MPCPRLLLAAASLPARVRGPVDFRAFWRLAMVLLDSTAKGRFWSGSHAPGEQVVADR
jgi:hypothetical protein